ncbi:3-hydroxymethylcephem carbamoyltransferase [Thermobifida halotolerans]|uniref:3-hydroxymethylcephem carbamoyltransferase n=1 Tax=Thermobifida halotolerans TaxID=483545 RepID=A0AA97M059_9ACTN|nr:carbamoyltransferase C-terminal domain-containing protein [Thermobifida halotolerans]UOE21189.1 3-hydroxymethylcephem carbamoyltransferase [Thermobifida halotolerans]
MLVVGIKPGHDGSMAVIEDGELTLALESEKDSFARHWHLAPTTLLRVAERVGRIPDVVALGGWRVVGGSGHRSVGVGYHDPNRTQQRRMRFFGGETTYFSSSHVRSHIMSAIGMAPRKTHPQQAVLVWEGITGGFYLVDDGFRVVREIPVLTEPGARYAFLFAVADPAFPDHGAIPDLAVSGKLMALAAYGDADSADERITEAVERILAVDTIYPAPKASFRDAPFHNAGVESEAAKTAAALLNRRIFEVFADAAKEHLPPGLPLRVAGGCGLNCDWNTLWRRSGYFSSVFVPPCPNDSGSAIGTAIDALCAATGDPHVDWSVYSGLEFEWDADPDPRTWTRTPLDHGALADAIAAGDVVAWVRGRWEIGPRALGNRSILAEPFRAATRDRLNTIKQRESYRPIAPCCRAEDTGRVFVEDFADPYMLYFRRLRSPDVRAVTHVDGTARAQTVRREDNAPLHALLSAFAARHGVGVLCNTSLNFKGMGFINRMSDLVEFCEARGLDGMVVDGVWFRRGDRAPAVGPAAAG